ncbi:hypothetical protein HUJ05_007953 [Dendroctonus ponderosae]|nr:hypothetical protein HUJ05_007953 [Dendroctonus ponderosae]
MFLEEKLLKLSASLTLLLNEDDPEVSLESMFRLVEVSSLSMVEVLVTYHRRQATFDDFNKATIVYYSKKLDQLLQGSDEDLLYTLLLGAVSKERAGFTVDKDLMVFITIILRDFGVYRGIFEEQLLIDEAIFKKRAVLSARTIWKSAPTSPDGNALQELKLLYQLFGKVQGAIKCLTEEFEKYIQKLCLTIVGKSSEKFLIQDLIDLKNKLDEIVLQCFQANPTFNDLIKNTFHKTINTESGQSALYLARYFDGKLRAKNITEENLEATFNKGMIMFRFLQSKDIFEAFYRKCLSKRLLFGRSTNQDIEHSIVLKMKRNAVKVLHRKSKECCAI